MSKNGQVLSGSTDRPGPWFALSAASLPAILVGGLVALCLLGAGMVELSTSQRESSSRVQHALNVLAHSATLRADLAVTASEGRGYLADRMDQRRARFENASQRVQDDVAELRMLLDGATAQQAALDEASPQIGARIAILKQLMEMAYAGDREGVASLAQTQRGRQLMDRILGAIDFIEAEERQHLSMRGKAADSAQRWLVFGMVGCGVLGAASVILAVAVLLTRRRERAHVTMLNASDDERLRTETALRASEARFRAMTETMPNLLFEVDASGRNVYVNNRLLAYTGQDLPNLPKGTWLQLIHPDDRDRAAAEWATALRDGTAFDIEFRLRRKDGEYRWFLNRVVPIADAEGVITLWIGTATDIDDQKQAEAILAQHRDELERLVCARTSQLAASEAELRETVAQLRLITEHSLDMVSRVGPDGTVLYVSPACQRLLGRPASDITREVFLSYVHPDDRVGLNALRARLFSGAAESEIYSYRLRHPDGKVVWVEAITQSMREPATGKLDGFISVLRDVTARRTLEDSLRHSQKLEAIGRISAGVAHDFNNLLQTVISGLELTLESMHAGDAGREFADMALNAATRGSSLTHHLLSYARKQVLQPRAVELPPFLAEMQQLFSRTLGPHIAVKISISSDTPPVCLDPNQLQTALLNLAINAADAMTEGGQLIIGADPAGPESEQPLVALRVVDNGTGMDPATLAQACEPFFTTKGVEGIGLGLSMVQGFAEQSGGKLRLESEVGRGTTVTLLFRAAQGAVKRPPDPAMLPQPSRRILVVDDEPDVLITAGAFLERAGLWVVRASSGNEALAILAGDLPFDALVTDYAMPGMNGADLLVEAQSMRPGLPALIITGFAEVRGLNALPGNVQILHKPFLRDDLLKALRRVMLVGDDAFQIRTS